MDAPELLAASLLAFSAQVGPWTAAEEAKLTASDAGAFDHYGSAVAVSGDTAVVGSEDDDPVAGVNAGAVYVYVRSGSSWTEQQKLVASDAAANDLFGSAVAVSGDTLAVGARLDNTAAGADAGSVYVFVRSGSTWTEQQKLTASDAGIGDGFGNAVALAGDTLVVGARLDNTAAGADAGSAYVFVRSGSTWTEQQRLAAGDAAAGDSFGWSVALADDTALVGAHLDDATAGADAGGAYVFVRSGSTWSEEQKLVASDPSAGDLFGWSVTLSGDTAIVGAKDDDHPPLANAGSAYAFVRDGTSWSQQQKLVPADASPNDAFGHSVALAGDALVLGTPFDDDNTSGAGSAYLYVRAGAAWCEQLELFAGDGTAGDQLGWSAAIAGDTAVVGANGDDPAGVGEAGAAYAFRLTASPFYCTPGTSASGCQALLSASGTASASAPSGFVLTATGVEGAKDGLFFFGTNGFQANPWGNGTSYQCIVPPVRRAGLLAGTGTAGACDGSFAQDLNALWCPTCPGSSKNPGATLVQAQLWYRDPLSTSSQSTSLSDAIEFCVAP